MKNLTDMLNEGLIRENHTSITVPRDEKEFLADKEAFEKELKESQRKQKDLEKDLKDLSKYDGRKGYEEMAPKWKRSTIYRIEREKAEQAYAQMMIDAIDEIIKDLK